MVLVGNRLLLDVMNELDATVVNRTGLSDVLVAVGCCLKDNVGHLSRDGADALETLDASIMTTIPRS